MKVCADNTFIQQIKQKPIGLRIYPDSILRESAAPVSTFDKALSGFSHDMLTYMKRYKGIGLAAPQIGVLYRVIVVGIDSTAHELINPEIVSSSFDIDTKMEGCLSLPDTCYTVERHFQLEVKARNSNGRKLFFKAEGLLARVIQHEVDHLNGLLICDKGEVSLCDR